MLTIAFVIVAYLLGSISFAVLTSKAFGLSDPRSYGSGNPGATNVLRSGKKAAAVALAVFLGHVFPVFLRFQGGKGVATALGVLLALNVWLAVGALVTWLLMAALFRFSSLAALTAAAGAPVYAMVLGLTREWVLATGILLALLVWSHKKNIRNLLAGKEQRIGQR